MAKKVSLQRLRSELGRSLSRAWDDLTEGWRELLTRSDGALTRFTRSSRRSASAAHPQAPSWTLLAADAWETAHAVIVRLELPGMLQKDIQVSINRDTLCVRGHKRTAQIAPTQRFHLTERAFGRFERKIALPPNTLGGQADVCYQDGVLTVIVPKAAPCPPTHSCAS